MHLKLSILRIFMKKLLFFPIICTLFCACNSATVSPDGTVRINQSQDQTAPADWQITLQVKKALLSDNSLALGDKFISVSTTDGVVTLTGEVSTEAQMNKIIKIVRDVKGVVKVNNQLTLSSH